MNCTGFFLNFFFSLSFALSTGQEGNFRKDPYEKIDSLGSIYDYNSVMHYSKTAFSRNGKSTLEPVGNPQNVSIGQRVGFSKEDIIQINALYQCSRK